MVSLKLGAFALFALKAISAYAQVRPRPMAQQLKVPKLMTCTGS